MSDPDPLFAPDPSDPEDPRHGTVIGSPARRFDGSDKPAADAATLALCFTRWSWRDLARVPFEGMALSVALPPIDRRVAARALYERGLLAGALAAHRQRLEDLVLLSEQLAALTRGAQWADPAAGARAREAADAIARSTAAARAVIGAHAERHERLSLWPATPAPAPVRP